MSTKGRPKVPPGRRPPPKPAERRRTLPLVGILIAVVAVLLVGALVFNAMTKDDASADVEQTRPVTVEGAALPRFDGTAAQDPGIGAEAPVLTGQGFDGGAITIGGPQTGSDGRPTLVMFVAHWCPHCQREVPLVVGWRADGTIPSDIDLVAVSTGVDPAYPNYPPSEWLADEKWPGGMHVRPPSQRRNARREVAAAVAAAGISASGMSAADAAAAGMSASGRSGRRRGSGLGLHRCPPGWPAAATPDGRWTDCGDPVPGDNLWVDTERAYARVTNGPVGAGYRSPWGLSYRASAARRTSSAG